MGSAVGPVILCSVAFLLSLLPLAYRGALDIGAILVALVGFRYVGFALFAKLGFGQALDSYLIDPAGSFAVVLVGVLGYLLALGAASKARLGGPLLEGTSSAPILGRISFLAALVGLTANLAVALTVSHEDSGPTVAAFFVPLLHLALIAAIARVVVSSGLKRSLDPWVVFLLIVELSFSMVRNSRMVLLEIFLCYVLVVSAFEYKIRWRQFALVVVSVGIMATFITPVFLYVRSVRGELSWTARISATLDAFENWPAAFSY
jgi:hypothetical protein